MFTLSINAYVGHVTSQVNLLGLLSELYLFLIGPSRRLHHVPPSSLSCYVYLINLKKQGFLFTLSKESLKDMGFKEIMNQVTYDDDR